MVNLTPRQQEILKAVVREYTTSAKPVSSQILNLKYGFGLSPATIRGALADLEAAGFITQPHTSAGRIPTDQGYRFYVNTLHGELDEVRSDKTRALLKERMQTAPSEMEMTKAAAELLSELTKNLAVAFYNHQMISAGFSRLFGQPEFLARPDAMALAKLIDSVDELFIEMARGADRTNIFIGHEMPTQQPTNLSVVFSRFKSRQSGEGFIGIIGPTRMEYERTIPLVEYISNLLEEENE